MRIRALIKSELTETWRNPTLLTLPAVVLGLALIYSLMAGSEVAKAEDSTYLVAICLVMAAYMVGTQFPATSLAENKEKRTLEAILLTPARPMDVIAAKVAVATLFCAVTSVLCLLIFRTAPGLPWLLLVGFLLIFLFTISIGVMIGLVAKDQKTAGVISAPIMMVLLLGTAFPWQFTLPDIWAWMKWLPTRPLMELMNAGLSGETQGIPVWQNIGIMLLYVGLTLALAVQQVRRRASAR